MFDIMALAFWSDASRVGTFMFGNSVSGRNFSFLDGVRANFHSLSHHQNDQRRIYRPGALKVGHDRVSRPLHFRVIARVKKRRRTDRRTPKEYRPLPLGLGPKILNFAKKLVVLLYCRRFFYMLPSRSSNVFIFY